MTRLALIFENDGLLKLSSDLPATRLAALLNEGEWRPPDSVLQFFSDLKNKQIRAVALEDWVFASVKSFANIPAGRRQELEPLSTRQKEVLEMIAAGLTSKQIALKLGLSRRTVNFHIASIKSKLGAQTNAQSVSRGTALGYCRAYMRRREN